jgi:hypothetical protein
MGKYVYVFLHFLGWIMMHVSCIEIIQAITNNVIAARFGFGSALLVCVKTGQPAMSSDRI